MRKYFRTHIIRVYNGYRIRKFGFLLGWIFLDKTTNYWWYSFGQDYSTYKTIEEAKERYTQYKEIHYL